MNTGKETISFRYLVIGGSSILFCTDDKDQLESYIQGKVASEIAVFERKYVVEGVLCNVGYEDNASDVKEQTNDKNS